MTKKGKNDHFECGYFERSILKASGCPPAGLEYPRATGRVRVVDGQVGQVRLD